MKMPDEPFWSRERRAVESNGDQAPCDRLTSDLNWRNILTGLIDRMAHSPGNSIRFDPSCVLLIDYVSSIQPACMAVWPSLVHLSVGHLCSNPSGSSRISSRHKGGYHSCR